jgi:DNA polymerase-3 subunit gamma/tau
MQSTIKSGAAAQSTTALEPIAEAKVEPALSAREGTPFLVTSGPTASSTGFAEALTEGALAKAPQNSSSAGEPTAGAARDAICAALAAAGHVSASQLLGGGSWTLDNSSLRIEVAMGKKMLGLTVNAAAEKIMRQELQRLGASSRFVVVPGAANGAGNGASAASNISPIAGSVQEEALKHPLVQRAKEIFNAEVRSVVDLRVK